MIASGPVLKERGDFRDKGFLLGLGGATVSRLNVYLRNGPDWREVFRETSGLTSRFFPFLLPMAAMDLDKPSGWLRQRKDYNAQDYRSHHKWSVFGTLSGRLGISLTLDDRHYRTAAQDSILAMLARDSVPTKSELQAFEGYWFSLSPLSPRPSSIAPDARDAEIATRLAEARQVPLPWNFYKLVEYGVGAGSVSEASLAAALATRLRTEQGKKPIKAAARAMAALSDDTLRSQLELLENLARPSENRPHMANLLHNLYLEGMGAAPKLTELVESGLLKGDENTARQGLVGLCKLGAPAAPFVASLRTDVSGLSRGDAKSYFKTHIHVAAYLGVDFETLRQSMPGSIRRKDEGSWLVNQYKLGQRNGGACQG